MACCRVPYKYKALLRVRLADVRNEFISIIAITLLTSPMPSLGCPIEIHKHLAGVAKLWNCVDMAETAVCGACVNWSDDSSHHAHVVESQNSF
jgi:hypothetical protein